MLAKKLSSTMMGRSHHASSCTSSGPSQMMAGVRVHRLRMADTLEAMVRAPNRDNSESPVDSEPLVDLFSALLTLLTSSIVYRVRLRLPICSKLAPSFRQPRRLIFKAPVAVG